VQCEKLYTLKWGAHKKMT